jgi:carboxyl-terminal processing protease
MIDLNQFVRSSDMGDLGALKQQPKSFIGWWFNPIRRVSSDIIMPDRYLFKDGERDVDHAMP